MQNTQRFKRLQHTLMLAFLVLSITPLILSALYFLNSHTNDLSEQSINHLASLRDNKQKQLYSFFAAKESEVKSFARSELSNNSGGRFYGLVGAFNQLGDINNQLVSEGRSDYFNNILTTKNNQSRGSSYIGHERYRLMFKRYNNVYNEYLKRSDFKDIMLVDLSGNVVYSVKNHNLFGMNLLSSNNPSSPLAETFKAIQDKTKQRKTNPDQVPIVFTDFSPAAFNNDTTAWFAAPIIQQGYLHSYVFMELSSQSITDFIQDIGNNPNHIQTLLVGKDHKLRFATDTLPLQLQSQSIEQALEGKSGIGHFSNYDNIPVLSAFSPLNIYGNQWALVVELPEKQAFARIAELEKIFAAAMVTAIILVIIASHYLSNSITAPLLRLTWAAEKASGGDLDQKIEGTERKDEIGRLAISFARMQRSIREKMGLIREQNQELEESLKIIRRKNIELETADKLKDEFLATTSHELRTPLHGMVGIAESLLAGANGPVQTAQRRQLEMIINSGHRLSNLVDDLLDYHKMRYGDLDIDHHAVDLSAAVRLVLELSNHLLGNKPIRIINQIPADIPLVDADEQRLEQVLYNLVGNAIKYTSEGKIVLSATVLEHQLQVRIVDTGQGIPSEQLEHIFEPLVQANSGSANYRQGAGLGLSISRQLVELMGGSLYVSSQTMVGTTFSFTLNLATDEQISAVNAMADHNHYQANSLETTSHYDNSLLPENPDGELLLVVDDEPVNLQILTNFLCLAGYRVKTTESGPQALDFIKQQQPDLVLLDIMMPEMSGYEVCTILRQEHSMLELPIIMLSALGQVQDRIKGFECGANDYLTKPFNKEELIARIKAYLQAGKTEIERQKNRELEQEIRRREQVEVSLLEAQSRLLGLLDSTSEAIICVHNEGRIRYANSAAGKLFNRSPEQLERHTITDILATHLPPEADTHHHFTGTLSFRIDNQLQDLATDVINLPEQSGLKQMFVFDSHGPSSEHRISLLENAVDVLSEFARNGDQDNLQQLRELGGEFTRLADKLGKSDEDKPDKIRALLVESMKSTLAFWEQASNKTKFELAEESGLWRVYLDRSTLQTRTLDKYLQLETLPKTPRWRTVINTMDYVLERCHQPDTARQDLVNLREQLHHMISHS